MVLEPFLGGFVGALANILGYSGIYFLLLWTGYKMIKGIVSTDPVEGAGMV